MKRFQVTLLTEGRKWELESDDLVHLTAQLMLKLVSISKELCDAELETLRMRFTDDDDIPF